MKFITGGFVGEEEAGQRLFQVAHDPRCAKSGVYWSWNGGPREDRGLEAIEKGGQISGGGGAGGGWDSIYENDTSAKVTNLELQMKLFKTSTEVSGAVWPDFKQVTSPCPTLQVVGTISKAMVHKEELKRMQDRPGFNADGTAIKVSKRKKVVLVADKITTGVLRNTVGRVARFASRRVLGKIPEAALQGSFEEEKPLNAETVLPTTPVETKREEPKIEEISEIIAPDAIIKESPEASVRRKMAEEGFAEADVSILEDAISNQIFNGKHEESKVAALADTGSQ